MKRIICSFLIFTFTLKAANVEPDDHYVELKTPKIDLVVAKDYQSKANDILNLEESILQTYEGLYGYKLDDTLYLGVASSNNQIANAFSTQIPFNMQMNYIGGSLIPDYFAASSWRRMLQIHESAHNFQLNAKKNPLARFTHKYLGNLPYTTLLFVPIFPVPNLIESSFILEGNAVLNESLFGNGGRLYSGAVLATVLTQARAGLITPDRCYNDHLYFPYGAHFYFVGGFFQLYMAQKYGIKKVDRYFLTFSNQWLPFFDNAVFKEHFGKNFENELKGFNIWLKKKYTDFNTTDGERIAFSKSNIALNSDKDGIYFLTTDARSTPELIYIDKKTKKITYKKGNFLFGRVFKKDGQFFTSASAKISNKNIAIGLFNKNGKLQKGSSSKAFQQILPDGEALYFDVKASFDMPKLYRDGKFLSYVNSSVLSDTQGNIYYFKQNGKKRTLYRNKNALFSYQGYYGKAVDVDQKGRVLFIANSLNGSTLYRYGDGVVDRLVAGDDVIDAKILGDEVLLEVVRADGISFLKKKIEAHKAKVASVDYFFEDKITLDTKQINHDEKLKTYKPQSSLHYSSLSQSVEVTQNDDVNFNLSATFSDPLLQNSVSIYTSRYDKDFIAGIGYENSANVLTYGGDFYGVISDDDKIKDRGYGLNLHLKYPFYRHTYKRGDLGLYYHLDWDKEKKSPLSLILSFKDQKQFGHSFYPNSKNAFSVFALSDRSDLFYGARYGFSHDLGENFYMGLDGLYVKSNVDYLDPKSQRGILIDHNDFNSAVDPSRLVMPSSKYDLYAKDALKVEASLSKVFEMGAYYYSFPLSLRREALYGKYRNFYLKGEKDWVDFQEYTLGMTFELLAFHRGVIPLSFEFLKNDDLKESTNFRMIFSLDF